MADLDREPFWGRTKAWTLEDEQETRKVRFEARGKPRSEVLPCDGSHSVEFLLSLTLPQFEIAFREQEWDDKVAYENFSKVLTGELRVAWEETLDKEYSDPVMRNSTNWDDAAATLLRCFLNCKRPRDVQIKSIEHD